LNNLSNKHRGICITAAIIIRQLTSGLVKFDHETFVKRASEDNAQRNEDDLANNEWHILNDFKTTLENYQDVIKDFVKDIRYFFNQAIFSKLNFKK
jgi:hypothetical protein